MHGATQVKLGLLSRFLPDQNELGGAPDQNVTTEKEEQRKVVAGLVHRGGPHCLVLGYLMAASRM